MYTQKYLTIIITKKCLTSSFHYPFFYILFPIIFFIYLVYFWFYFLFILFGLFDFYIVK